MNDLSPTRAADILDMLITVYNEEAIKDKNRISVNTAEFIKERLQIIEHELGSVETDIEDLKERITALILIQLQVCIYKIAGNMNHQSRNWILSFSGIIY